jgi:hypothetical protein
MKTKIVLQVLVGTPPCVWITRGRSASAASITFVSSCDSNKIFVRPYQKSAQPSHKHRRQFMDGTSFCFKAFSFFFNLLLRLSSFFRSSCSDSSTHSGRFLELPPRRSIVNMQDDLNDSSKTDEPGLTLRFKFESNTGTPGYSLLSNLRNNVRCGDVILFTIKQIKTIRILPFILNPQFDHPSVVKEKW